MDFYNKKRFDPYNEEEEQDAPAWETQNISQLVAAIKQRNAAARHPQSNQKKRSRKKVNEVLLKIFDT